MIVVMLFLGIGVYLICSGAKEKMGCSFYGILIAIAILLLLILWNMKG